MMIDSLYRFAEELDNYKYLLVIKYGARKIIVTQIYEDFQTFLLVLPLLLLSLSKCNCLKPKHIHLRDYGYMYI